MRLLLQADARALPIASGAVSCVVTSDYGHADQIGLEPNPDAYVQSLVAVFREVRRVLRPDGTLWLNLGDSYSGSGMTGGTAGKEGSAKREARMFSGFRREGIGWGKQKDLLGIPWRVAFALQADGWYLRSDIIWAKPNPMPESVTDRPTKAHEYVFLLTKSERYFYDAKAIREKSLLEGPVGFSDRMGGRAYAMGREPSGNEKPGATWHYNGWRNKRSVWDIAARPYTGAHFATMPESLAEPCILAGSPLGGVVLDPFCGSGTTIAVAERLGRHGVGVDLTYHGLAKERTAQRGLAFEQVSA